MKMTKTPLLLPVLRALSQSWTIDTSRYKNSYSVERCFVGQDDVSAIIVQDCFGADIMQYPTSLTHSHYFNIFEDAIVDPAEHPGMEYDIKRPQEFIVDKPMMLTNKDIRTRYTILRHIFNTVINKKFPELQEFTDKGAYS